jgi:hypothetical protein
MRRALLQDIELMPQCQISASNRRRDLKQSHSSCGQKGGQLQSSGDHVLIRC